MQTSKSSSATWCNTQIINHQTQRNKKQNFFSFSLRGTKGWGGREKEERGLGTRGPTSTGWPGNRSWRLTHTHIHTHRPSTRNPFPTSHPLLHRPPIAQAGVREHTGSGLWVLHHSEYSPKELTLSASGNNNEYGMMVCVLCCKCKCTLDNITN